MPNKANLLRKALWIFLMLISPFFISYAQVTIGTGEEPVGGALLQLKDKENISDGSMNAIRGMVLPRVNLSEKKQLFPMFLNNPEAPGSGANSEYSTNKSSLDKSHTGLIVYNLNEDDNKELCLGLNQWNGEQWNCFQHKIGNAIATIKDCSTLNVIGQYLNNVSLTGSNYMTVDLTVSKAGAYTITARMGYSSIPTQDNGYYFTLTGIFMTPGDYSITIPGAGTPLEFTPNGEAGDVVTITFNDKPLVDGNGNSCPKNIIVEDSSRKPYYVMDCSSVKVKGVYQINTPLSISENFIEVDLEVDIDAVGAAYIIETNTVEGIYFKASGLLTGTTQTIKLLGYGTPTSVDEKVMTITSNSATTVATCKATVPIAYTTKVTYGWGYYNNTAGYIMQVFGGISQGTRKIIDAKVNFGTDDNSTVKVARYSDTQTFNHSILDGELMGGAAYNPTQVKAMFDKKPEIVLVGFDLAIEVANRVEIAGYMVDYLKAGGVLILALERDYMAKAFFEALYPGISVSASSSLLAASTFQLGFMDDSILNGPFGDIRGTLWGNDTLGAISITGIPEEDIVVFSRDASGRPIIFKHKYYNLLYIGEGGVFANLNGATGSTSGAGSGTTSYPLAFNGNHEPITRTGWTGGNVENARLFANAMAWAIKQAQFNGINTP